MAKVRNRRTVVQVNQWPDHWTSLTEAPYAPWKVEKNSWKWILQMTNDSYKNFPQIFLMFAPHSFTTGPQKRRKKKIKKNKMKRVSKLADILCGSIWCIIWVRHNHDALLSSQNRKNHSCGDQVQHTVEYNPLPGWKCRPFKPVASSFHVQLDSNNDINSETPWTLEAKGSKKEAEAIKWLAATSETAAESIQQNVCRQIILREITPSDTSRAFEGTSPLKGWVLIRPPLVPCICNTQSSCFSTKVAPMHHLRNSTYLPLKTLPIPNLSTAD